MDYSLEATYYRTALLLGVVVVEPEPPVIFEAMFGLLHADLASGRRGLEHAALEGRASAGER